MKNSIKYLFICVHPDDLEFNCSNLMNYLSKKGKHIDVLSLTKGEFGIYDENWKGPIKALYFYTTIKPSLFWPFNSVEHGEKSLFEHKSQWWLLKWVKTFYPIEKYNLNKKKRKIGNWKYIEKFRRVSLFGPEPKSNPILRGVLGIIGNSHFVNPKRTHYIVPNLNSKFGKKIIILRKKYQ